MCGFCPHDCILLRKDAPCHIRHPSDVNGRGLAGPCICSRLIAQNKMFAIHNLLGEDAQIFSPEEHPTASALFDKLRASLDSSETLSSYTKIKQEYNSAKNALLKQNPNALERIGNFPAMIKTAWKSAKEQPLATFMFKRMGGTFSAIVYEQENKEIREWLLDDALEQIACRIDEPREAFTAEFWKFANAPKDKSAPHGGYETLKRYTPEGIYQKGGVSDAVAAVNAIMKLQKLLSAKVGDFAAAVADDI